MDLVAHIQAQIAQLQSWQDAINSATRTPVAPQQETLLKLYDEFVVMEEGKQLAESLEKFAEFAKSRMQ